ncbi:MAG: DNA-protecting protein DprA [Planctomycetia bacterium]|nr:DNA-protecting protein DprA [Planctomycetia bacterium]
MTNLADATIDADRLRRVVAELTLAQADGVGPRLRRSLLDAFGSAEAALAAPAGELQKVPGIGKKTAAAVAEARNHSGVDAILADCRDHGVRILLEDDEEYPAALKTTHTPPAVLFVRGRLDPRDALALAVVGTRHATAYGLRQAEKLAGSLARSGFTIVSGLARGIDGAAHKAALAAGGRTIAVLGSGVLNVYPPEHNDLAEAIIAQGAVVSESLPRAVPIGGIFPQRNRIISGLSLGVLVIEAPAHSGALSTARHALEQGREVFAVPGPVDGHASQGCHRLIRDGARLVESADDVLEELGPLAEPASTIAGREVRHPGEILLNDQEQRVLAAIGTQPTSIDELVAALAMPTPQVLATLSVLELRRLIRRLGGAAVCRV